MVFVFNHHPRAEELAVAADDMEPLIYNSSTAWISAKYSNAEATDYPLTCGDQTGIHLEIFVTIPSYGRNMQ